MTDFSNLTHADIDWNQLWKNARQRKGWASKGAADWDKKSSSFAMRNTRSPYADLLISQLPLQPDMTVLDVGSGPGTLALPLSERVSAVTALDFSPAMLEILRSTAAEKAIRNISTIECAWEDDWAAKGVSSHDVAIASRSLSVDDLGEAIKKLNAHARKFVFIADRISPTPFDPEVFRAVGRPFDSGPDYIYTLNILYTMGIHANVTVLQLEKDLYFQDIDQAMQTYSWMIRDITPDEEHRLKHFLLEKAQPARNGGIVLRRDPPPSWALIWWAKEDLN